MFILLKKYFGEDFPLFEDFKYGQMEGPRFFRWREATGRATPPFRTLYGPHSKKACGDMVTDLHDNMSWCPPMITCPPMEFSFGGKSINISPPKRQLLRWTITSESASNTISSKILEANKVVKIVCYVFLWTLHHFDWCRNAIKNAEVVRFWRIADTLFSENIYPYQKI